MASPRLGSRPWFLAGLVGFLGIVAVLSLSDRAPSLAQAGLSSGRSVFHRGELRLGVDLLHRSDVPLAWDTAGHLVLWAAVAALAAVALGRGVRLRWIVVSLVVLSGAVEIAQVQLSATRMAEWRDLVANSAGITAGALAGRSADVVSGAIGRAVGRLRSLTM